MDGSRNSAPLIEHFANSGRLSMKTDPFIEAQKKHVR
jgi:hypothetical protein